MSARTFKVGDLLLNDLGQFTKVIAVKNGLYGLSGWMSRKNAEKSTIATLFINRFGLGYANVRSVAAEKPARKGKPSVPAPVASPTASAPVKAKGGKGAAKKGSAKPKSGAKAKGKGKKKK